MSTVVRNIYWKNNEFFFDLSLFDLTRGGRKRSFVAAISRFKIESRSSTLLIRLIGKQLARLLLLIKNTVWRTRREEISDGHTCYLLLQS